MTTTAISGSRNDRMRQTTIATRSGQPPETSTGATIAVITAAGTASRAAEARGGIVPKNEIRMCPPKRVR